MDGKQDSVLDLKRPFEHPLLVDRLVLGGEHSLKGTLQDVRVNGEPLLLGPDAPAFLRQPLFGLLLNSTHLLNVSAPGGC